MGTGCSWVGCCSRRGSGKENIFVFLGFLLEVVFFSFVGCVRVRTSWLYSQQVSYKITAGSCDCVLLSKSFSNWPFNVFHTGFRTIVVATARHCFPSKVAGNVICSFHHRCSERVWARIRGAHRTVVFNLSTVAPLASSSLLRQHVGAEFGEWLVEMGRFDHAAVKRLVLCVLLPVYRSGGYCRRRLCSPCVNRPG